MITADNIGAKGLISERGWTVRPYMEGDIPLLVSLINAADAIDNTERATTEEELAQNYAQPLSDPPTQVIIVEGSAEGVPAGMPLAYGRIISFDDTDKQERIYQMGLLAHPSARKSGLELAVAAHLVEMARSREDRADVPRMEKVTLLSGAKAKNAGVREVYKQIGLREVRWGWTMERPLSEPIDVPKPVEGVTLRHLDRPADNARFLEAYNTSFIDHFEFHAMPQEMFDYMLGTPHVRPDLSWVAEIDTEPGTLAGFCLCEINNDDNARTGRSEGWIALLGTVRGWRGKGLGKSLLLQGLHSLRSAGIETALLGVDSESLTGANRLYESVGFTVRDYEVLCKASLHEISI